MLIGRLTQDPEARTTPNGQQVTSFSVATNKVWIDKSGQKQEKTEFHNVVVWGKLAETMGKFLVKGQEVCVEGSLQTRSWEAQDGVKKYRTEIVGSKVEMGQKPAGAKSNSAPKQQKAQESKPAQESPKSAPAEEEINIEDIPF